MKTQFISNIQYITDVTQTLSEHPITRHILFVALAFTRIVKLLVSKFLLVSVDATEPRDISWYWNTLMEFSIEAQLKIIWEASY